MSKTSFIASWFMAVVKAIGTRPVVAKGTDKTTRQTMLKPYNEALLKQTAVIDKSAYGEIEKKAKAHGYDSLVDFFIKNIDSYKGKSYTSTRKADDGTETKSEKLTAGVLNTELLPIFKTVFCPKANDATAGKMMMFLGIHLQQKKLIASKSAGIGRVCYMHPSGITGEIDATGLDD